MICIIALIVFGIMGIFSVTYRKIAKEAFDCVFRRVTFRKCNSNLDKRLKSQITGKLIRFSPKTGKFVYKYFEVFSWIFLILMVVSTFYTIKAGYNYYEYGNCNGPEEGGFCIFDPTGKYAETSTCNDINVTSGSVKLGLNDANLSVFEEHKSSDLNRVVYVGCYFCANTRKVNPTINELVNKNKVDFYFAHLPLTPDKEFISRYTNCVYEQNQDEYWKLHNLLMTSPTLEFDDEIKFQAFLSKVDVDKAKIIECANSSRSFELVEIQKREIAKMGVEGTPTVFVNDAEPLVGVRPLRAYRNQLKCKTIFYFWHSCAS